MKKNVITNKITPCCSLPFPTFYFWIKSLTLNSEANRELILSKLSQNGILSIDAWKVLINSGRLEGDSPLTKAQFLSWFDCGNQPTCEQLKVLIESYQLGYWVDLNDEITQIIIMNDDSLKIGTLEDKWNELTSTMPSQVYPAWQGIKVERNKQYIVLVIDIKTIGFFDAIFVDGSNNKLYEKTLEATTVGKNVFEIDFKTHENYDSYFGISTNVNHLYNWDDGVSSVEAVYAEGGFIHNLGKTRLLGFYLIEKSEVLQRKDVNENDIIDNNILVGKLGAEKVGFKPESWSFATGFFTVASPNWHGIKLEKNKTYKRIFVYADRVGEVKFYFVSEKVNYERLLVTATLKVGLNILVLKDLSDETKEKPLYVGEKGGFLAIRTSVNSVMYGDGAPSENVAYSYEDGLTKINGRVFKFYIESDIEIVTKDDLKTTGLLFDHKINNVDFSSDVIDGSGGIYNGNGWFANTAGLGSRLVLNKYFALGERTFICRFKGGANSQISLGSLSENEGGMGSRHDDFLVNFSTKKIYYKIINETYVEENAPFLNPANEYTSEITRNYNKVKFTVTDLKTGEFSSIERMFDGEGGNGDGSINPTPTIISLLHDKYSIYLSAGDFMEVKQFTVLAGKKDVDLIAYGDSISEPEFYYPSAEFSKSWVQLMKSEIESRGGKAIISGRSSTNITQLLDRIKNELPFIRAKFVMITIGTNGGNSEANLSELIEYIFSQNSIPILNNIPCNESGTQVADNILIEKVRQKYGIEGTKFDIPTSINYDGLNVDNSTMFQENGTIYHHPNIKGAKLMQWRTKIDVPYIYG